MTAGRESGGYILIALIAFIALMLILSSAITYALSMEARGVVVRADQIRATYLANAGLARQADNVASGRPKEENIAVLPGQVFKIGIANDFAYFRLYHYERWFQTAFSSQFRGPRISNRHTSRTILVKKIRLRWTPDINTRITFISLNGPASVSVNNNEEVTLTGPVVFRSIRQGQTIQPEFEFSPAFSTNVKLTATWTFGFENDQSQPDITTPEMLLWDGSLVGTNGAPRQRYFTLTSTGKITSQTAGGEIWKSVKALASDTPRPMEIMTRESSDVPIV